MTIDIKRILLTTAVCVFASFLSQTISKINDLFLFLVPLLFSILILLTCFDKIKTKKKYQALVLNSMLSIIIFFFSFMFGLFLGKSFLGQYALYLICTLSGLLTLLSFSLTIHINNIKLGIVVTTILALLIPPLSQLLKEHNILLRITFFEVQDMFFIFFIVWQTFIGLAIAISIWTKTSSKHVTVNV